jgi:hypothetical protein
MIFCGRRGSKGTGREKEGRMRKWKEKGMDAGMEAGRKGAFMKY